MTPIAPTKSNRLGIIALTALLWFTCANGYCIDGPEVRLPHPTVKLKSGWILEVDGRGIDANGYRPIRVTVSTLSGKPVKADHQVRVVLGCHLEDYRHIARVSQVIEIPEGSQTVTATLLVPQGGPFTAMSIDTFEGGEKLLDLCTTPIGWPTNNNWNWNWTEARPSLLFIDSNAPSRGEQFALVQAFQSSATDSMSHTLPDVRQVLSLFPDSSNQRWMPRGPRGAMQPVAPVPETTNITDAALLTLLSSRSRAAMIPPAELPSRWIELSQFDVAVIPLADLKKMAQNQKNQLAALRDWLSTGPLLIVAGCGQSLGELTALEKLLDLPALDSIDQKHPELCGWRPPRLIERRGGLKTTFDENGDAVGKFPTGGEPDADTPKSPGPTEAKYPPPFVLRPAGLGCVVAVAANQPFPGNKSDWSWIFNEAGESHWQWFKRSGFSTQRTNNDFWKLLIPGVGQAPVWSYLFLVSLFAVVIGPLNYLLLDRVRRLYLLLITVPVGAVLVTSSLFAFAMLSDGVRMRLRARSFADLDQTTGQAAVWSRQSYYAAIAPSQGLHFPADTTVFPMRHDPGDRSRQRSTLMVWDGHQELRGAYLASRTAEQFMVCRATTTEARLVIDEGETTGALPKIENNLGSKIRFLLVRNSRGDYFSGESIPDKATTTLQSTSTESAEKAFKPLADAVSPGLPPGYDDASKYESFFNLFGTTRYRPASGDAGAGDPLTASSLLETNIRSALAPTLTPPPKGSYLAIVENSPLVLTGVGPLREESSFHLIRGHYQAAQK